MFITKTNTKIGLAVSLAFLVAGCGSGGSSSAPAAASGTGTTVDLADSETALKVAALLISSSALGPNFVNSAWNIKDYEGASRTETRPCRNDVFTSADALPSVGDSWAVEATNCTVQGAVGVTYSESFKGGYSLAAISNVATPEMAGWSARETTKVSGTSQWTILVTNSNFRYDGKADYTIDSGLDVSHSADGSQSETYRSTVMAKGTENSLPFDYTISGEGICSYAATTKAETCSGARFTLTGQISGKSVNAVLSQPAPNVTEGVSTYEITQGNQKITVTFSFTGGFSVTTANGTALGARYTNLLYIAGY